MIGITCQTGVVTDDYLTSVGLPPSWEDVSPILFTQEARWQRTDVPGLPYVAARPDPSGFAVTAVVTDEWTDHDIVLAPRHPMECAIWQLRPGLAEVTVVDPERADGSLEGRTLTKVLATVDEPHLFPVYPLNAVGDPVVVPSFGMGAVAVEFTVWESAEEWDLEQEPVVVGGNAAAALGSDTVRFAPEFIMSPWLWAVYGGRAGAEEANAAAQVRAVCNTVALVRNEVNSGAWLRIDADCGFPITVAAPADAAAVIHPGCLLDGRFVLTGTSGSWYGVTAG